MNDNKTDKNKLKAYIEENAIEIEDDIGIFEELGEPDSEMEVEVQYMEEKKKSLTQTRQKLVDMFLDI